MNKLLVCVFAVLAVVLPGRAAPGELDAMNVSLGNGGVAWAMAMQPDGKFILAGNLGSVNGVAGYNLVRLNPDGTLDTSFAKGALGGNISCVAVLADGKILLGGLFSVDAGGGVTRKNLVRFNADGTLDTNFAPEPGSVVYCLAVQVDGKILVGGAFATIGGGSREGVARLNADGTLDASFNAGAGVDAVFSMALQDDGKVVLGGNTGLRRVTDVGAVDSFGTVNDEISCVALQADGKVVVSGPFTSPRSRIARFNADGTFDATFAPYIDYPPSAIAVQADGAIVVTGLFAQMASSDAAPHVTRNGIGRLFDDAGFDPRPDGLSVSGLALQPDGKVLISGNFASFKPNGAAASTARAGFARLDNTDATQTLTRPDATKILWQRGGGCPAVSQVTFEASTDGGATWTFVGNGTRVGTSANWQITGLSLPTDRMVRARGRTVGSISNGSSGLIEQVIPASLQVGGVVCTSAVQPDGKTIIGGQFSTVLGESRSGIARLNVDGTLDPDFVPVVDSSVFSVVVENNGSVLIGGIFSTVNGAPRNRVARLRSDGSLDSFDPNVNGEVDALAVQSDGSVLIAGGFTAVGGTTRNRLSRVTADGTLDMSFDPNVNDYIFAMVVQNDGRILIGGYFVTVGGTTRHHIARIDSSGALDMNFDPDANQTVYSIAVQADGKILLGGFFFNFGGSTRRNLVRVMSDGTPDPSFVRNPNSPIYSVAVQADGEILFAGGFDTLQPGAPNAGNRRNFLARVGANGVLDGSFNPIISTDSGANSVALEANGNVLAVTNRVNRFNNYPATQTLSAPDPTQVIWRRGGSAPELTQATFEQKQGAGWVSLGAGTRIGTSADWQLTGLSLPGGGMIRALGRVSQTQYYGSSSGLVGQTAAFDFATLAPTLNSPPDGGLYSDSIPVNITLPEDAKPGTMTLSFGSTVLTFASAYESAGTYGFSFDPGSPSASFFASSSPISDGTYTVTLSYQDAAGHSVIMDSAMNVTIERVKPTIGPPEVGFTPRFVFVGDTLADYAAVAERDDASGIASVTQQPPAGTTLSTVGTQTVKLTARDNAGNTQDYEFTVEVRPLAAESTVFLAQGEAAPGRLASADLPDDAVIASFGSPATDGDGDLAFVAKWTGTLGGKVAKGTGLFLNDKCLAVVGGDASAIAAGAKWKSFTDPVVEEGHVVCIAKLSTGASAVVSNFTGAALEKIAMAGETAPSFGGDDAKFKKFTAVTFHGGTLGFLAQLSGGTGTHKVTAANDTGLWARENGDVLQLIFRDGFEIGSEKTIGSFVSFQPGLGSPGQGRGWLSSNPGTLVLTLNTFTGKAKTRSIGFGGFGGYTFLALTGETGTNSAPALAGASFATFRFPALNDALQYAFYGTMKVGAGGVTKADAGGIFAGDADFGGPLAPSALVAQVGHDAGGTGAKFSVLKDPVLSPDGTLAFQATIKGGTVKGLAAQTIWWRPPGQPLEVLAQGGARPGSDLPAEAQWKSFTSLAIAAVRGPIFAATLVPGKGGVLKSAASGVWACDFNGDVRLLFRTGDQIDVGAPGTPVLKKVKSFKVLTATVGSTGVTRSFNDSAQVVWLATFMDKTTAIVTTEVP